MYDMLILAEKPSAARRFAKFLNGKKGTFHGRTYWIEASHGHLMTYKDPPDQVRDPTKKKRYKSWQLDTMPWNVNDFAWQKTYIVDRNPRTHRNQSDKPDVMRIGKAAMHCRNIVNFSDNDPSGEGDLLAQEIDNQIIKKFHWQGNIYRGRFKADTVKSLVRGSLANIVNNPNAWLVGSSTEATIRNKPVQSGMSAPLQIQAGDPTQFGIYQKGVSRARWDWVSMQLTRICTTLARKKGYNTVVNQGRLKSVILYMIYLQLQKIKNYHKIPYYEVRFKDENGHIYSRKASAKSHPSFRHVNDLDSAKRDMAQYHASAPAGIKTKTKTSAPGPLLNLSALSSRLSSRGYSASQVLKSYQNLYEAGYVSYPRTADKKITQGDFDALLPKVNSIAKVVGVDPALLTHRTLRSKYRVKVEDHGANRPGMNVPKSLSALRSKFGQCGVDIYSMLAKNYLAILCEDYVYKKTSAHLADYPKFTTSYNQPVKMNYKLVFDNASKKKSQDSIKPLGHQANPIIHQGQNPRPTRPTQSWITNFLNKNNVGTGATQTSTIAELTKRGKRQRIKSTRGKFSLTQSGLICAVMARGTFIASTKVTKQLFSIMDGVAKHKYTVDQCTATATQLVEHDKPIMERNSDDLMGIVGKPKGNNKSNKTTPISANFQGQQIKFWPDFMKKNCTKTELQQLLAGKTVVFTRNGKYGQWHPMGKLVLKTKFNGKPGIEYVGSKKKSTSGMVSAVVSGKKIKFWPTIMGKKNKLTPQHIRTLQAGNKITCILKSSNGKTKYKVEGKLSLNAYKGHPGVKAKFLGFVD